MNKFTIILPTRERADTLHFSLKTCVAQDYPELQILVSDNCSSDNTYDVVHSFNDPRIRYIKPQERLSMSHHWEFALEHVNEGFVMFLGDDDGILPNSLLHIDALIDQYGVSAVNWRSDHYLWPSFNFTKRANLLKISLDKGHKVLNGATELTELISCKKGYEVVPWLYKGFVDVEVVRRVQRVSKAFFCSRIPDVYSGIVLATVIDTYIYSYFPFTLDGVSGHSNGTSFGMATKQKAAANLFLSEKNLPMHEGFLYCQSAFLLTAESVFQAIDHHVLDPKEFKVDIVAFLKAALTEVQKEPKSRYDNVMAAINYTAEYFKISTQIIANLTKQYPNKPVGEKYDRNVEGFNRFKNRIEVDASKYGVDNVYDATLLDDKIRKDPSAYMNPLAVTKSTAKFVVREIKKRYF